ncbi:MAG: translocation/assembly module TamB domain-containing protein [Candidatus Aminicenantes bacterium]|nr:translocation/assembly module TamB domain-containing protein [Candidatus Aminicenantes bacterium]
MKELTISTAGARFEGRGVVKPPGGGESRLDLSWASLDLSRLPAFIPGFPALYAVSQGKITANWMEPRIESVRASGEASFRSLGRTGARTQSAPGSTFPPALSSLPFDGDLTFAASRDGLDFSRAVVRAAGSEISLSGRMRWDGSFRAGFRASFPDLTAAAAAASVLVGPFDGLPDIGGRARLEGTVEGTFSDPIFRAELSANGLSVNGLTVDSLEAALSLDGRTRALDISRFKANLASGTLEGRFSLRPAAGKAAGATGLVFDASAGAVGLDLAFLAPLLPGTPLSGRVAFKAEGRGPLEKPVFSFRLSGRDVGVPGIRIPALVLSGESDGTLARAKLTAGLTPDAPAPLILEAELPLSSPYPVKATLKTDKLIIGSFLEASGPRPTLPSIPLTAEGSFFIPLEDLANSIVNLSFTGIELGSLAALAGVSLPPGIGGMADAWIRAFGDPSNPAALTAEGEINRLVFSGDLPALESKGPVRFALRDGAFELKELTLGIGDSLLRASGIVRNLTAEPEVEARLSLDLDASLLPPSLLNMSVGGRLKLDFSVNGPLLQPVFRGEGGLTAGFLQARDFPLTLSDLSLRLELRDRSIFVTNGKGLANGGLLGLSGRIDFGKGLGIDRAVFEADLEGFRLNYPPGLVTLSEGKAKLEGDGKTWLLSGNLRILQGSFREDVFPGAELFGFSNLPLLASGETSTSANNFKLNITAATVEPIIVRNNMADFALEADIRVSGTTAAPLITGRVRNVSVGEIVFGERRYTLETLRVEFLGKPVPDPEIEIVAYTRMTHRMEDLEIQLRLSGPASDLKFNLTSTPPHSSQDLSLLLLTGKSMDEVRGVTLDTLKSQMVLYFASPLFSSVTRSLEKFLNVDDISFAPLSIASEEDPGARLTFVKNLSDQLALTYSIDVSRTQRQSWFMDYSFSRSFILRAFKKDDGSYGGSFRHAFSPWGEPEKDAGGGKIVSRVEVEAEGEGGARLDRRLLEKAWKPLRVGRPFRVSDLGRAIENLNRLYRKSGYPNAVVTTPLSRRSASEEGGETEVVVIFRIKPGEPAVLDFRGDGIPAGLKKKVRTAWTGNLSEAANLASARELILRELMRTRYYRAEVKAEAVRGGGTTTYAISVAKNGRYSVREVKVEGSAAVEDSVILKAASDFPSAGSRGYWNIVNTPRLALRSVKRAYEERGYTKAVIEVRRLEVDTERRTIDIVLSVVEGPKSVVRSIGFDGNSLFTEKKLRGTLVLDEGKPYDPAKLAEDRTALLNLYTGKGYQDVEIAVSLAKAEKEGGGSEVVRDVGRIDGGGSVGVAIVYKIKEGSRHTISSIEVSGETRTGEDFIRMASGFKEGQPLTSEGLGIGQKQIYDTRIFRSVNIESEPEGEAGREPKGRGEGESENKPAAAGQVLEKVRIEVREMPPLTLAYGLRYNSEEKFEGFGELDFRSLFGEGRTGLFYFRRNARQSDLRFSLESSYLFGLHLNLLSTVYTKRDVRELFTADETGLTLQSRIKLPSKFDLSPLYRMNKIHIFDPRAAGPSPIEESVFVSEIGGVMVRDTRDDLLDPKRGSFLSLALTWSPKFLATELPYVSVFGQFQTYLRFGPGLVWAAAARVGAADAFGRELVAAKRFFAGGGNSVRGFKQDGVGPIDPLLGAPAGGAVVFVINQELRFPILGPVSGVIFYDAGNVYSTLRDVRVGEVRHGVGLGLRVRSPIGLVRADYGINRQPRPGEKRGVFYLSIGQAF